ncbi:hypothetical protein MHB48_15755 [Psychrobacillus sp. FSL H8-0483]|uniref:hypothetical protein n=1 Tax=Psychrobacillus sp. FSL H8-0483 TaxID=2921389 RepID=UPI00315A70A8
MIHDIGKNRGMTICNGIPAFTKSKNLYPPAVITNAFVDDATGVAKAILEETAMAIKKRIWISALSG